jgi:predicted small secreted protein
MITVSEMMVAEQFGSLWGAPKENPVMRYLLIAGCLALVGCNTMNGRPGEDTQRSERPLPAPEPAPYYPASDPLNSR